MENVFTKFLLAIVALTTIALVMALPTQYLWNNCLIYAVDWVNPIGFWQALGINVLASILFKSSNNKISEK